MVCIFLYFSYSTVVFCVWYYRFSREKQRNIIYICPRSSVINNALAPVAGTRWDSITEVTSFVPVVQWIEQGTPKAQTLVRFQSRTPLKLPIRRLQKRGFQGENCPRATINSLFVATWRVFSPWKLLILLATKVYKIRKFCVKFEMINIYTLKNLISII